MLSDDDSKILPPAMNHRARPQTNRTILGVLLALLLVAIVLALWFLLFDNGESSAADANGQGARPTPLTIATAAPIPQDQVVAAGDPAADPTPGATTTPVPDGFQACLADQIPLTTTTYVVDTNTTPLNQRQEPAVSAAQSGTFAPGQDDLVFTGNCVVNVNDSYTWWEIFNGTDDVWIASDFVTPN